MLAYSTVKRVLGQSYAALVIICPTDYILLHATLSSSLNEIQVDMSLFWHTAHTSAKGPNETPRKWFLKKCNQVQPISTKTILKPLLNNRAPDHISKKKISDKVFRKLKSTTHSSIFTTTASTTLQTVLICQSPSCLFPWYLRQYIQVLWKRTQNSWVPPLEAHPLHTQKHTASMQAIGHQPMTLTERYHLQKRVEILIVPGLWAFVGFCPVSLYAFYWTGKCM